MKKFNRIALVVTLFFAAAANTFFMIQDSKATQPTVPSVSSFFLVAK